MNIRQKLTLQFSVIVTIILISFSIAIYFSSATYRKNDFRSRLRDRATTTAKLLIEVKEVDSLLLRIIDKNTLSLFDENIRIFNFKNEEIYSSTDDDTSKISTDFINDIRLKGEIFSDNGKREILGMTYAEYPAKYVVVASAYDKFGIKKLQNLRLILLIGFGISFLLTILSGMFYAGRALKPMSVITNQVKKITVSNLNLKLDTRGGKDEIADLAGTFNNMLERLETSFELQKTFISNASHEFRTPFTSVFGKFEMIQMKERSNKEYKEIINSVYGDLKKLNSLSEDMLDLAYANLDVTSFQFVKIRIDELLFNTQIELAKRKSEYKVNLELRDLPEDDSLITINGNEQLLKTALLNIMSNSCKFSEENAVQVKLHYQSNIVYIEFIDKGIGIPDKELSAIFEPFYRASNVTNKQGHGLGLSIVKKIIEHHKGNISVESKLNKGSKFIVSLPVG